jgi:hypothetical protein
VVIVEVGIQDQTKTERGRRIYQRKGDEDMSRTTKRDKGV